MKRALAALYQYSQERGVPFRLYNVTPEYFAQMEAWYPGRFRIEYDEDSADYVYESEKLCTLAGKKLHGKAQPHHKFKSLYEGRWSYETMSDDNLEECFQMALKWRNQNGCDDDPEKNSEMCGDAQFPAPFQRAGADRRDPPGGTGRSWPSPSGSPSVPTHLSCTLRRRSRTCRGAYTMINQQFVEHECMDYKYVNREEDTGDEGLRRAKRSYRPVFMVEKGTVTEKQ